MRYASWKSTFENKKCILRHKNVILGVKHVFVEVFVLFYWKRLQEIFYVQQNSKEIILQQSSSF